MHKIFTCCLRKVNAVEKKNTTLTQKKKKIKQTKNETQNKLEVMLNHINNVRT